MTRRSPFVPSRAARAACFLLAAAAAAVPAQQSLQAGAPELRSVWQLPATPPSPAENTWTEERAELGKKLFFDPRLGGTGQVTCASCHMPERGWSDGQVTSRRFLGRDTRLNSPGLANIGFNTIVFWDGRVTTLEEQGFVAQGEAADINAGSTVSTEDVVRRLAAIPGYQELFAKAYPGEGVTRKSIAKALASFQRGIVSRDTPFDRWVAGDSSAMTAQQVNGFRLFLDPAKGACAGCHQPPNFTDNGFHNLGLKSYGEPGALPGRHKVRPLQVMHGAFKTPPLRDVGLTRPYFHDGSAATLRDVVEHYARGGDVRTNLSPSFRKAELTDKEKDDLVAFLGALTAEPRPFAYPVLPK